MSKALLGSLVGLVLGTALGLLDALSVGAGGSAPYVPYARSLFVGGVVKGLLTGGVAGMVAQRTRSFSASFATGVLAAVAFTVLAWVATHDMTHPPLLPAIALGGASAVAAYRWGR